MSRETFNYDGLIAGDFPNVTANREILSGQILARGSLLGKFTSNKILDAISPGDNDGTQLPFAILAEDVDTTQGNKFASVYLSGEFNKDKVIVPSDGDIDDFIDLARNVGLYLKTVQE